MRSLTFALVGARPLAHAIAPTIVLDLAIEGGPIESAMLACQIAIEPPARAYDDAELSRLDELFGTAAPPRALMWTQTTVVVPGFANAAVVDLVLPCPLDNGHAAAKYAGGVLAGAIPIVVQLSGSVFYTDPDGRLQVAQIPRDREARFAMPVSVWRAAIDRLYPNRVPIALDREVVERLHAYRRARGLVTIEQALVVLLDDEVRA